MMKEEEKEILKELLLRGEKRINARDLPADLRNEIFKLLNECGIKEDEEIISWLYFDVFSLINNVSLKYSLSIGALEEKIKEVDKNFDFEKFWEWLEEKDKRYWKFFKIMLLD
ncbi:MAG: hypothetical protein ACO2PO_01395 [Candidatus Calescibacterium sp.]